MDMRWIRWMAAAVFFLAGSGCEERSVQRNGGEVPYTAEIVAQQLDVPWAIDFAPDGRLFVTERPGTIRVWERGRLLPEPVISFPPPFVSTGEGGLLGLAVDPGFTANHYLYVYHTYAEQGTLYNRVVRLRERNNRATVERVLIDRIPGGRIHNGGRLKIGPDGKLYITTGDAGVPERAQDPFSLAGKILRLNLDGSIPADNPFPGSPVFSWGHRNPQGLAWSPDTGTLYSSEHGSSANDEINLINPGANYGWPVIQGSQQARGMRAPLLYSGETTWAPAGMAFVTQGPWRGRLLVAALRGEQLLLVNLDTREVEGLYQGRFGRIRDVVEAKDGSLYILTSNRDGRGDPRPDDDKIIMLRPSNP
jgi:glucose/arabinose dehydrogenase